MLSQQFLLAKRVHRCCKIVIILLLLFPPSFSHSEEISTTLILDLDAMSSDTRAMVLKALGKAQFNVGENPKYSVKHGDSLSTIVTKEYKYSDRLYPAENKALVDLLADINGLSSTIVRVGQELALPQLPVRPLTKGSSPKYTQLISDIQMKASSVATSETFSPSTSRRKYDLREGTNALIKLTIVAAKDFFEFLWSGSVRNKIMDGTIGYVGPTDEVINIHSLAVKDDKASPIQNKVVSIAPTMSTNLKKLSNLDPKEVGHVYVLDYFASTEKDSCTHGQLVLEQIRNTLEELGAEKLMSNVDMVELDFFSNRDEASKQIEKFIASRKNDNVRVLLQNALNNLKRTKEKKKSEEIPLLYLKAIFENLASQQDPHVSSVTASFWTVADMYSVFPENYGVESPPLIAAVLNDDDSKIEEIIIHQPMKTFYEFRQNRPFVLVGSEVDGKACGMVSRRGDGVTFIAPGQIVGKTGVCKGREAQGTSFAAPIVATYFMLADASLRKGNDLSKSFEMRTRMLLTSDVIPDYVSKYASGGKPNIGKMLLNKGAYLVTKAGQVVSINSLIGKLAVEIIDPKNPDAVSSRAVFGKPENEDGTGVNQFRGLQIVGEKHYLFQEPELKWKEVKIAKFWGIEEIKVVLDLPTDKEALETIKEVFLL